MTYAIVNTEDLSGYDFELLRQDRAETCRKSIDGTMAIVSWIGEMPDFVDPISTHDEQGIIELTRGEDWTFELQLRQLSTAESRQDIIDQLTTAAESSGLSVPFESFYYKYRNEIFNWVNNGGDSLIEIFTNDTSKWLDMRESDDKLSPREFALGLLMPTTEETVMNEVLVDVTDVVEASVWKKIKNWFKF